MGKIILVNIVFCAANLAFGFLGSNESLNTVSLLIGVVNGSVALLLLMTWMRV